MMKAMIAAAAMIAALLGLACYDAQAGAPVSATKLVENCSVKVPGPKTSPADAGKYYQHMAYCLGYMRGYGDALDLWEEIGKEAKICVPEMVVANDLRDVMVKYWHENPKDRHLDAQTFVGLAFLDAWPCKTAPSATFR